MGIDVFRQVEKAIALHTIDTCWQEHLQEMDELKDGIGFVGVGGKNPLIEYKKGAFDIFESLIARISQETLKNLFQLRIDTEANHVEQRQAPQRIRAVHRDATNMGFQGGDAAAAPRPAAAAPGGLPLGQPASDARQVTASGPGGSEAPANKQPIVRDQPKVGRNDPCPCGSGKKYKRCHGINE